MQQLKVAAALCSEALAADNPASLPPGEAPARGHTRARILGLAPRAGPGAPAGSPLAAAPAGVVWFKGSAHRSYSE